MSKLREPPEPGYLLAELGYVDEIEAAAALDLAPKTLTDYRKNGVGPDYVELARNILYSRDALAKWLAAGGTKGAKVLIIALLLLSSLPASAQTIASATGLQPWPPVRNSAPGGVSVPRQVRAPTGFSGRHAALAASFLSASCLHRPSNPHASFLRAGARRRLVRMQALHDRAVSREGYDAPLAALLRIELAHVPKLGPESLFVCCRRALCGSSPWAGNGLRLNVFTSLRKLGLKGISGCRPLEPVNTQGLTLDVSQTFKAGGGKSQ